MTTRAVLLIAACGLALTGCSAPTSGKKTPVTDSLTTTESSGSGDKRAAASGARLTISDPCPSLLQETCAPMLLYLRDHYRLPETLDELRNVPGFESIGPFECPTTKRPYVYNPAGVVGANVSQRAVLYDAAPSHSGYRWAIVIYEAAPNAPFQAKVVAWPESRFPKNTPR
jgi:hypothetical protein